MHCLYVTKMAKKKHIWKQCISTKLVLPKIEYTLARISTYSYGQCNKAPLGCREIKINKEIQNLVHETYQTYIMILVTNPKVIKILILWQYHFGVYLLKRRIEMPELHNSSSERYPWQAIGSRQYAVEKIVIWKISIIVIK